MTTPFHKQFIQGIGGMAAADEAQRNNLLLELRLIRADLFMEDIGSKVNELSYKSFLGDIAVLKLCIHLALEGKPLPWEKEAHVMDLTKPIKWKDLEPILKKTLEGISATHEEPMDGLWYWVRGKDGDWFPAMRDKRAAGGWTNLDTWEDFAGEITEWRPIPCTQ